MFQFGDAVSLGKAHSRELERQAETYRLRKRALGDRPSLFRIVLALIGRLMVYTGERLQVADNPKPVNV